MEASLFFLALVPALVVPFAGRRYWLYRETHYESVPEAELVALLRRHIREEFEDYHRRVLCPRASSQDAVALVQAGGHRSSRLVEAKVPVVSRELVSTTLQAL